MTGPDLPIIIPVEDLPDAVSAVLVSEEQVSAAGDAALETDFFRLPLIRIGITGGLKSLLLKEKWICSGMKLRPLRVNWILYSPDLRSWRIFPRGTERTDYFIGW